MNGSGVLLAGMTGLFSLALGYVVIFVLYQRRMISRDLQQQKLENEYQKNLLQSAIEGQEAERKRIAHDLHDEIGALLTTSRLYFNQLSPGHAEEQLQFDEMITNIRRISHDLRPVILENLGLIEAIESIRTSLHEAGVDFNFTHQLTCKITSGAELMLYRIVQELVNNTLRHAHASTIDLLIETRDDQLYLDYKDNGVGLVTSAVEHGLGFKSIATRLSLMGTTLQVTKPAQGVHFLIRINIGNL
jgi:signal transduction histidine kinase